MRHLSLSWIFHPVRTWRTSLIAAGEKNFHPTWRKNATSGRGFCLFFVEGRRVSLQGLSGPYTALCARSVHTANTQIKMADIPEKRARVNPELEAFDDVFTTLVETLTKQGLKDEEIQSAMTHFKQVCEYNVPHGKKNRGLAVLQSYKYLKHEQLKHEQLKHDQLKDDQLKDDQLKDDQLTQDDLKIATVVGWCIEFLQAFFLVADDVMDQSTTRRGQPCWYKKPGIGYEAINDSFYLESAIYVLLKKYCRDKPYYMDLVELFHETTMQTVTGQCLDMLTASDDVIDFTNYTLDKYNAIVKYKTAFYSFYLPVAAAMYMAGITDSESHTNAKTILLQMGEYFQVQDDYLDCYGDPAVTGKVGTDIEVNKCSWLVVQALQRVTPEQRTVLQNNYGRADSEKVARVKALYNELDLRQVYLDYEEASYTQLQSTVSQLSQNLPRDMFLSFAKKIYKRQK